MIGLRALTKKQIPPPKEPQEVGGMIDINYEDMDWNEQCRICGYSFGEHRVKDYACPVYDNARLMAFANTTFKRPAHED